MATNEQIARRFFTEAFADKPKFIGTGHSTGMYVRDWNRSSLTRQFPALMTYGFTPLAVAVTTRTGRPIWLFNADTTGRPTITRQQDIARQACRTCGGERTMLLLPFSALDRAGVIADTIDPIEVLPDRWVEHVHTAAHLDDVPAEHRQAWTGSEYRDIEPDEEGYYRWITHEHFLGAALFVASYGTPRSWSWQDEPPPLATADFLSAFDAKEPGRNYFLCQLPDGSGHPYTVAMALEALKPVEVVEAEADGRTVLRQGDMFAIPTDLTTRQLKRLGCYSRRGIHSNGEGDPVRKHNQLHRSAHTASERVVIPGDVVYARGVLRHEPGLVRGRTNRPDHRAVHLGQTWHRIVRNTVPLDDQGRPRAWQITGHVD